MAKSGRPTTAFVNLNELPEGRRTCELCENQFSDLELNGAPGYAVYPVRLLCGHIFCYDCARMWIGQKKCPECDARFRDQAMALEAIDEQIRQYKQYQVACFNGRLQAGMIRAPPGYPTFAGQKAGPSKWWHEDDTADKAVSKAKSTSSAGTSLRSKAPSLKVTNPEGRPGRLQRHMAANGNLNADREDRETFAITKSEQTGKEFRMALGMINKMNGTNYTREDFPNLKLKYERKPRH